MNDDLSTILLFAIICCVIMACIAPFMIYHVGFNTGQGEQIGYISEVANSGVFWRPDQIHLINSEPTFGSQTSYAYGSESSEITKKALYYVKTHEKVIVTYKEHFAVPAWEYHSCVIIVDIKPISSMERPK